MDQPRRTGARLQLFQLFRFLLGCWRRAARRRARLLLRSGLCDDGGELAAADAAVAVAVDGEPVAVLRCGSGELFLAQEAVLVAIEAFEQGSVGVGAPRKAGTKEQRRGEHQPLKAGQREHPATIAGESGD